jgi:hypothetical protein
MSRRRGRSPKRTRQPHDLVRNPFLYFFIIILRLGHADSGPALGLPNTCKQVPLGVVHKHANSWEVLRAPRKYISTCTPSAAPRIPSPHAHDCTPLRGHACHNNGLRGVCMLQKARHPQLQPLQWPRSIIRIDIAAFPLKRLAIQPSRTNKLTSTSQRLL